MYFYIILTPKNVTNSPHLHSAPEFSLHIFPSFWPSFRGTQQLVAVLHSFSNPQSHCSPGSVILFPQNASSEATNTDAWLAIGKTPFYACLYEAEQERFIRCQKSPRTNVKYKLR